MGKHEDTLQSFELALRNAGIHKCNIVKVSSIIPPGCKLVSKNQGLKMLNPGQITFVVLSKYSIREPYKSIAASIGMAIPSAKDSYGYLSEYHSFNQSAEATGNYAEDLAATMLATTKGIFIISEQTLNEKKQIFKSKGLIIKTRNITQLSKGEEKDRWTTVLAAAVFIT